VPSNKELGGPQSCSGLFGEDKTVLPLSRIIRQFLGRPSPSLETTLNELPGLRGYVCLFLARQPPRGPGPPHSRGFFDHTQRCTTVGRTPLDEWSARRRDLYLTTHNTHNRRTSMPTGGIGPHNLGRRAADDLRLRPRGHWDRHFVSVIWSITRTLFHIAHLARYRITPRIIIVLFKTNNAVCNYNAVVTERTLPKSPSVPKLFNLSLFPFRYLWLCQVVFHSVFFNWNFVHIAPLPMSTFLFSSSPLLLSQWYNEEFFTVNLIMRFRIFFLPDCYPKILRSRYIEL
jgi:hypothetical protein